MIREFKNVRACGYYRLSREDGDKYESDSIKNQRILVREFAQKSGIDLVDEYADDGYTGTNFNRPAFIRLMEDAKAGRIGCVVVKDLSRMGRNYIEMGRLLTGTFPVLGVRVIAINDNYDSAEDDNSSNHVIVPFKNLINDAYCRDLSLKIRSQLDLKRKRGKFIGAFPTYGYERDEKDHGRLVIDETAGKVVEFIFNMKLDGYSTLRIVQKLNELGLPTPLQYKRICGYDYNSGFRGTLDPKWSATAVNRILRNEIYAGTLVQGKRRKVNYKVKSIVDVAKSDWIRVENAHDAIVPRELFDATQKLLKNDTRVSPAMECLYPLSGLVRCGSCGQNLIRRMSSFGGKKYHYLHCTTHKNGNGCTPHNVSESKVSETVLAAIRQTMGLLSDAEGALAAAEGSARDEIGLAVLNGQMEAQARELERYGNLKVKLYADLTDGVINREEYAHLKAAFAAREEEIRDALRENEKRKERKLSLNIREVPWIREFTKYRTVTRLDRRVAVSLIESVVVYDGGRMEVCFRHGEEIREIMAAAGLGKEETG